MKYLYISFCFFHIILYYEEIPISQGNSVKKKKKKGKTTRHNCVWDNRDWESF